MNNDLHTPGIPYVLYEQVRHGLTIVTKLDHLVDHYLQALDLLRLLLHHTFFLLDLAQQEAVMGLQLLHLRGVYQPRGCEQGTIR